MIIILDDDRQFCDLIKIVLEMEGYRATVTQEPDEVLPLAHQLDPSLVLMDVHVADIDTFDVLEKIKVDKVLKDIPVVMTSGIDYGVECRERGAAAFLFKPFRPTELLTTIASLIGGRDRSI